MRISRIDVTIINVPFVAPIRWSGGANEDWTRLVVEMETDDGLVGLGETLGGKVTKALIDTEIAPMFLGESPFHVEKMLGKATFVPLYYGKAGYCAIAALEVACWDLMGKATGRPVCELLGGRLRDEVPFAAYIYHRNANREGWGEIDTTEQVVAAARGLVDRYGFGTIKYKGGVKTEKEEVANMWALREAFPELKLRFDPQAIYSAATAIRMGKEFERIGLEYYEDPVWGNVAMARVRRKVDLPFATNMCVIDLDSLAEGYELGSVDVILGDIFEWGGIANIKKLQGMCEVFQMGLNFHSAGELGIGQAAYLHMAAACQALPFALDTHATELGGEVIKAGVIGLTDRGTMKVPQGSGLGVELDPDRFAAAKESYTRLGDRSVYEEDKARAGVIPVKSML
jgi:glucarate dehydratase